MVAVCLFVCEVGKDAREEKRRGMCVCGRSLMKGRRVSERESVCKQERKKEKREERETTTGGIGGEGRGVGEGERGYKYRGKIMDDERRE